MGAGASSSKKKDAKISVNEFEKSEPEMLIAVRVVEARGLTAMDANGLSDPYVIVECRGETKQTRVIPETLTPVWDEDFEFAVFAADRVTQITIQCFDYDVIGKDDLIGEAVVILPPNGQVRDIWYELHDGDDPKIQGEVRLRLEKRWIAGEDDDEAIARVRVLEARDLPAMDSSGTSDPYVKLRYNAKEVKTSVCMKTLEPKWYQTFDFNVLADQQNQFINLSCWDWDRFDEDDMIGVVSLPIPPLDTATEEWYPLMTVPTKKGEAPEEKGEVLVRILLKNKIELLEDDAEIRVRILAGRELGDGSATGLFCLLEFGGESQHTKKKAHTTKPQWDQEFLFPAALSLPPETPLVISVFDMPTSKKLKAQFPKGIFLGRADILLERFHPTAMREWVRVVHPENMLSMAEILVEAKLISHSMGLKKKNVATQRRKLRDERIHSAQPLKREAWVQLERRPSLGSSGLDLDFERAHTTSKEKSAIQMEEEVRRKQRVSEMDNRRKLDSQWREEEMREKAEMNLAKDRNSRGKCARCGEDFSFIRPPMECPMHRTFFHGNTVQSVDLFTCYDLHLREDDVAEEAKVQRQADIHSEQARRRMWDARWEAGERLLDAKKALEISKMQQALIDAGTVHKEPTEDAVAQLADASGIHLSRIDTVSSADRVLCMPDASFDTQVAMRLGAEMQVLRIYVASDVDDMSAERQMFSSSVPRTINEWLRPERVQMMPVDLRYGCPRSRTFNEDFIRFSFAEIDKCQPYFVGFVGERYGWIPSVDRSEQSWIATNYPWLSSAPEGASLLHLELLLAHLHPKSESKALYYFRDPVWLKSPEFLEDCNVEEAKLELIKKEAQTANFVKMMAAKAEKAKKDADVMMKMIGKQDVVRIHLRRGVNLAEPLRAERLIQLRSQQRKVEARKSRPTATQRVPSIEGPPSRLQRLVQFVRLSGRSVANDAEDSALALRQQVGGKLGGADLLELQKPLPGPKGRRKKKKKRDQDGYGEEEGGEQQEEEEFWDSDDENEMYTYGADEDAVYYNDDGEVKSSGASNSGEKYSESKAPSKQKDAKGAAADAPPTEVTDIVLAKPSAPTRQYSSEEMVEMNDIPIMIQFNVPGTIQRSEWSTSDSMEWNQSFVLPLIARNYMSEVVSITIFTRNKFLRLRQIGQASIQLAKLPLGRREELELDIEDNDEGCLLVEVEVVPANTGSKAKEALLALQAEEAAQESRSGIINELVLRACHSTADQKLARSFALLKQRLRAESSVVDYPVRYEGLDTYGRAKFGGLGDLARRISEDLFSIVENAGVFQVSRQRSYWTVTDQLVHSEASFINGLAHAIGHHDIEAALQRYMRLGSIDNSERRALLLLGTEGAGRTATLARLLDSLRLTRPNGSSGAASYCLGSFSEGYGADWQHPCFIALSPGVGDGPQVTSMRFILHSLAHHLAKVLDGTHVPMPSGEHRSRRAVNETAPLVPIPWSFNELRNHITAILGSLHRRQPPLRLLIAIDGAERLFDSDLHWLPSVLYPNTRIILTSTPTARLTKVLSKREKPPHSIKLQPLAVYHRKEFVRHVLARAGRQISSHHRDRLVSQTNSDDAGYLALGCSYLLCRWHEFGNARIGQLVSKLPSTTSELAMHVLSHLEDVHSVWLVKLSLSLLEISYGGLTEKELAHLLAPLRRLPPELAAASLTIDADGNLALTTVKKGMDLGEAVQATQHANTALTAWLSSDPLGNCFRLPRKHIETVSTPVNNSSPDGGGDGDEEFWPPPPLGADVDELVGGVGATGHGTRWDRICQLLLCGLLHSLRCFLLPRDSRVTPLFYIGNAALRQAVRARYMLHQHRVQIALHKQLVDMCRSSLDPRGDGMWPYLNVRAARFIGRHMLEGADWDALGRLLTDLRYIEVALRMGLGTELSDLYMLALHFSVPAENAAVSPLTPSGNPRVVWDRWEDVWEFHRFLNTNLSLLNDKPHLLLQLASNEGQYSDDAAADGTWGGGIGSAVGTAAWNILFVGWEARPWLRWRNKGEEVEGERGAVLALHGHTGWIRSIRYVPDGSSLMTCGDDGTLRFWDRWSGLETLCIDAHQSVINDMCISNDGQRLATVSTDGLCKIWDLTTALELLAFPLGVGCSCVVWSPDRTHVVVGVVSTDALFLIAVDDTTSPQPLREHRLGVRSLVWSPLEDDRFVSASSDGTAAVWRMPRKPPDAPPRWRPVPVVEARLQGHSREVRAVAWVPFSETTITASDDRSIKLWKASNGRCAHTLEGHSAPVLALAVTATGTHFASGSSDKSVRVWDIEAAVPLLTLLGHDGPVFSVAFSHNEHDLATGAADSLIRLWNVRGIVRENAAHGVPPFAAHTVDARVSESLQAHRAKHRARLLMPPNAPTTFSQTG